MSLSLDMKVVETHAYSATGDQSVSTLAEFISKLPNGWKVKEIMYLPNSGNLLGKWFATVESPEHAIERTRER